MLSVEARQVSRWKKALAWRIYQRRDLAVARALHATSKAEASDLRAFGLLQPIAIVPNGVELPSEQSEPAKTNGVRTALFLSRLHPIKGLRDLINAWEQLRPQGWEVVIAGPDENNHRGEMEELVASKNLHREFRFVGSVDDKDKMQLYRAAELFILPSHSESFGQSVAEALSAGVPVITTCATPWQQIETFRCGWWIDPGVEPLTVALREATKRSPADLQEMGQRGRKLIAECFTWKASAEKMMEVFRWLGEGDKKPDWLV